MPADRTDPRNKRCRAWLLDGAGLDVVSVFDGLAQPLQLLQLWRRKKGIAHVA